ncbi:2-keto-4-pentenoate hydratase [Pararhodobacter aggregans]|uniref:2-keto-4-pentenoate hydratase n=1 Tax=Pararhodobacter aggregans TaxID=404875 RepID=UPI000D44C1D8|nr:hypothetical protein [Pararhodobacter aggregans]PTX02750.1 hypothetical protein C8N33_104110 [Pararhodobacter aggregans]
MITIADAILHAFDRGQPMAPITDSDPGFDLPRAYQAQALLTAARVRRGARVVGVKTGFTNTTIWDEYNVHAPIHGPVFDTTWRTGPLALAPFLEPRIEPEIVLKLGASPAPGMGPEALKTCVAEVARGFEIVHSPFPGWRFRAPDTVTRAPCTAPSSPAISSRPRPGSSTRSPISTSRSSATAPPWTGAIPATSWVSGRSPRWPIWWRNGARTGCRRAGSSRPAR